MEKYSVDGKQEVFQSEVTVSKVNILSVMKFSFLVSVALGIAFIVLVCVAWFVLNSMHVFSSMQEFVGSVATGPVASIVEYFYFSRVLALSVMVAILNTVVLTTISVLYAYIYNLVSHLVGGVKITISDE